MIVKGIANSEDDVTALIRDGAQKISSNLITMDHIEPSDIFDSLNLEFGFEESDSKYCQLPKEFFSNNGVPPPLVCKSWLSLVYRKIRKKESENEDSLPLSELKTVLSRERPRRKAAKKLEDFSDDEYLREPKTEKRKHKPDVLVINRKRGRPKKTEQTREAEGNSQQDNIDDWWHDDGNDSDLDIPWQINGETKTSEEIQNETTDSFQDYFEKEDGKLETKSEETPKKKKKQLVCEVDGKSKLVFPCNECNKTFSAASTLKYHMRIHNGTLIKCTECDKGFTTNYLLKCHMRVHNGDLFMCHKCGRGFTTAELLKVHSRGHTGDRPFTCHVCGKAFPSASNLRQHKETHEVVKKYLCFQCGSSFSQKRCLDGHMLSHGEKNHICTVCGKLWARKSDLTEHMRVHTGSKPYSCNLCPQKFTQASSLRRHQIVHMEAKPIPCLTCGRVFKCEDYYKRHVKKHEKETNNLKE